MSSKVTVIDLIRHGEPEGGIRIRGWRDDPLSDTGWKQMWSAVNGARPWQVIVTSPLARCMQFARQLANEQGIGVSEEPRLREIGFGDWEGADPAALYAEFPEAVSRFWEDPTVNTPPEAEPFYRFQGRVLEALDALKSDYQGQHILVVAHGGVIRMLLSHVLGMPASNLFRMEVPFAAVSRIRIEDGVPRLSFHCGTF